MSTIYLSSTYADLEEYRLSVIGALRLMSYQVICMEDYGAADQRPLHKCLRDLEGCEVYVGLFAWRYGFVPTHDNPAGRSITELEYRYARQHGKACLIFLLDPKQAWPPGWVDNGNDRERLDALRAELGKLHLVGFFSNKDDLSSQVATAVQNQVSKPAKTNAADFDRRHSRAGVAEIVRPATRLCRAHRGGRMRLYFGRRT